ERTASRTASASHRARSTKCWIPVGSATPAASADCRPFLRSTGAGSPVRYALAHLRVSTRPKHPAKRSNSSPNPARQAATSCIGTSSSTVTDWYTTNYDCRAEGVRVGTAHEFILDHLMARALCVRRQHAQAQGVLSLPTCANAIECAFDFVGVFPS